MPGETPSSGEGSGGAPPRPCRPPGLAALLLLVALYLGAAMMAAPARPTAMTDFFASRAAGRPVRCHGDARNETAPPDPACAPARAAAVGWAAGTDFFANCVLATALAPALGAASDASRSRVPFLAAGLLFGALPPAALALHLTTGASLLFYFPASALSTALPGAALIFAYVADALPPAARAGGFGAVGAALWVGVIGGSLLGGRLAPATAACAATAGTVGAALLAAFLLPETLGEGDGGGGEEAEAQQPPAPPTPPSALRSFRDRAFTTSSNPYAGLAILGRHALYARLTAIVLLTGAVADGSSEVLAQFLQVKGVSSRGGREHAPPSLPASKPPLSRAQAPPPPHRLVPCTPHQHTHAQGRVAGGFGARDQARLLASLGAASLAAQALALPALLKGGVGEPAILAAGLAGAVVQCVGLAAWAAPSPGGAVGLVAAAGGLSSLASPAIAALKANAAGRGEQGAVQGALAGARAAAAGVGPVLFATAFWLGGRPGKDGGGGGPDAPPTPGPFPGAPYALGALLSLLALRLCQGVAGDAAAVAARGGEGDGEDEQRWAQAGAAERVGLLVRGGG